MRLKTAKLFIIRFRLIILFVMAGLCVSCSSNPNPEKTYMYTAKSLSTNKEYGITLFNDIGKNRNDWAIQSVVLNENNDNLLKLDGSKSAFVYDFKTCSYKTEIVKPSLTGHDNDCCILEDTLYIVGSSTVTSQNQQLFKWSLEENIVEELTIKGIDAAEGESIRCLMGICTYSENELLLITQDFFPDLSFGVTHKDTDLLCVYKYQLDSSECEKIFEMQWDAVFIQGATYVNQRLYVACNIQTSQYAGNYKGIEFKVINLDTKNEEDKILLLGTFEAEGLTSYTINEESYLLFGICNPGKLAQITKMKI